MPLRDIDPDWLRSLIDATADVTWTAGERGFLIDASQWAALTGQSASEVAAEGWMNAVHPDDAPRVRAAWRSAVSDHTHFNADYRLRRADGSYRWYNARAIPILNKDGSIKQWLGVMISIPARPRLEPCEADDQMSTAGELGAPLIRAARAMLDWSAADLSKRSGVSVSTIRRLESDDGEVHARRRSSEKLISAFQAEGVMFVRSEGRITGIVLSPELEARSAVGEQSAGPGVLRSKTHH